jgi:hypothetical protein
MRKIRHYKKGGTVYFKRSELNDYIAAGVVEPKRKSK